MDRAWITPLLLILSAYAYAGRVYEVDPVTGNTRSSGTIVYQSSAAFGQRAPSWRYTSHLGHTACVISSFNFGGGASSPTIVALNENSMRINRVFDLMRAVGSGGAEDKIVFGGVAPSTWTHNRLSGHDFLHSAGWWISKVQQIDFFDGSIMTSTGNFRGWHEYDHSVSTIPAIYALRVNASSVVFADGTVMTSTAGLGGGGGGSVDTTYFMRNPSTATLNMSTFSIINVSTVVFCGNIWMSTRSVGGYATLDVYADSVTFRRRSDGLHMLAVSDTIIKPGRPLELPEYTYLNGGHRLQTLSGSIHINATSGSNIYFMTGGTTRFRIDGSAAVIYSHGLRPLTSSDYIGDWSSRWPYVIATISDVMRLTVSTIVPQGSNYVSIRFLPGTASYSLVRYDTTSGQLFYDTSVRRAKTNISDWTGRPNIERMRVRTFVDRASKKREIGLIAEELEAAGFKDFCVYSDTGTLVGVAYEKIALALIPVLIDQKRRIEKLEAEVAALRCRTK